MNGKEQIDVRQASDCLVFEITSNNPITINIDEAPQQINTNVTNTLSSQNEELKKSEEEKNELQQNSEYVLECNGLASMVDDSNKTLLELAQLIQTLQDNQNLTVVQTANDLIQQKITLLKQQVIDEEINNNELLSFLSNYVYMLQNKDYKVMICTIKKILSELNSLNIPRLKSLLDKVDHAAYQIKGKKIILVIGNTGSGKSTSIHFLCGSEMEETFVNGDQYHIGPKVILNPAAENIITNPMCQSVTQVLTPVPIQFKNKEYVICDTPGFEDQNGVEVDIANGISVVRAIQGANSVRVVIVISSRSSGDRLQGIKRLAHILTGMLFNFKDQLETFSYIFNKFNENEQKGMAARIQNLVDTMNEQEKLDDTFVAMVEDLRDKAEENEIIFLKPLEDQHSKILQKLTKGKEIANPSNIFTFYITKDSSDALQKQVYMHQNCINIGLKHRNFGIISYKLDELQFLNSILEKDYILNIYEDCIKLGNAIKIISM